METFDREENISTEKLKAKSISGAKWVGAQQFLAQAFQFVVLIVLARLLTPADFGVVGMAAIFTAVFAAVNEFGFSSAIIQRKDCSSRYLSTAFWASLAIGVIVFVAVVLVSPLAGWFFRNELVAPVLIVSSTTFIISSFGQVQAALLSKELAFKKLARVNLPATAASGLFSIAAALLGFGVWSIVLNGVVGSLVTVILLWRILPWRPRRLFAWTDLKNIFSFGSHITGGGLLNQLTANLDYLIIGRFLGPAPLGYYTLAFKLADFPRGRVSPILSKVAFPAFSKVQDDDLKVAKGYLKMVAYLALTTWPLMTVLLTVAPEFMRTIYGGKWAAAIVPLQILIVRGALASVGTTVGSIFLSKGRPDIQLKFQIVMVVTTTLAVLGGVRFGIAGVALALSALALAFHFIIQSVAMKLIDSTLGDYLRAVAPAAAVSTVLATVALALKSGLYLALPGDSGLILIASLTLSLAIYFLLLKLLNIREAKEILQIAGDSLISLNDKAAKAIAFWPFPVSDKSSADKAAP